MRNKILILGLICLFIYSCVCNCDKDMDEVRSTRGAPEETSSYDSTGYHSVDWWYWSQGICYTFTWGSNIDECCEVSTYRFDPISINSSKELKNKIKENKNLSEK